MSRSRAEQSYDRNRLLRDARRASTRRAHAKSAELYSRVAVAESDNADVLRRVAAQRVRAGQHEEALRDCRTAAQALSRRGFVAEAIGVYNDYTRHFPREAEAWRALSDLEIERGRTPDAVEVLVQGSRHLRSRRNRAEALELLRRARALDRTHFEAGFELADAIWRSGGGTGPARRLLESLFPHARTRRDRLRARARLFRLAPTPAAAWRWLRAALGA